MLLSKVINRVRHSMGLVLTVFICGILILSTAFPAYAVTSSRTEGEASLNRIQKKTDDVARTNPRSLEEITKESQKGLNAVQGGADKDKMVRPEDTDATSVKEKAANFIEDLTN